MVLPSRGLLSPAGLIALDPQLPELGWGSPGRFSLWL